MPSIPGSEGQMLPDKECVKYIVKRPGDRSGDAVGAQANPQLMPRGQKPLCKQPVHI